MCVSIVLVNIDRLCRSRTQALSCLAHVVLGNDDNISDPLRLRDRVRDPGERVYSCRGAISRCCLGHLGRRGNSLAGCGNRLPSKDLCLPKGKSGSAASSENWVANLLSRHETGRHTSKRVDTSRRTGGRSCNEDGACGSRHDSLAIDGAGAARRADGG